MIPEIGDIWQYSSPVNDNNCLIVLIYDYMGCHPSHFSTGIEYSYYGYDMRSEQCDEFFYNDNNKMHWRKLA